MENEEIFKPNEPVPAPLQIRTIVQADEKPSHRRYRKFIWLFVILLLGTGIGYTAIAWCEYMNLFSVQSIDVKGNVILSGQEVLEIADIRKHADLFTLSPEMVQSRLERFPYIYAAVVSKQFPDRLEIYIKERLPLCYLSGKNLILLDKDGVVLPVPRNKLKGNLPVLTGFPSDSLSCSSGYRVSNPDLVQVVRLLDQTLTGAPELFSEISEINRTETGELILYSLSGGTPIMLGKRNIDRKFVILAHFQQTLKNLRRFGDYQYLDLRWEKQVIAKERSSQG
ncbi:MAG: FtsQ-type POTRA domain-containing protein [Candidatus Neomarinimicrobiota bacterium]